MTNPSNPQSTASKEKKTIPNSCRFGFHDFIYGEIKTDGIKEKYNLRLENQPYQYAQCVNCGKGKIKWL